MRKLGAFCLFAVVACMGMGAKAQHLHQELYGTLFNTGIYYTEDVYARQFHDRCAAAGDRMRILHIADAFYNGGVWNNSKDSTTFVYNGVRGWDSVLDEWAYDTLNNFIVNLPFWKEYDTDTNVSRNYYGFNANLPQRRVFTYASNGKLGSYKLEELQQQNQWAVTEDYSYSYDATYRRVQQASPTELITYNYDIKNLLNIQTSKNVNGSWKVSTVKYYHYDTTDGRLREIIHAARLPSGDDYETDRVAYAYDGNGKVTAMYQIINKSLLVKDTTRTTYTYNDSGYIATMLTQRVRNGLDSNIQRVELRYNYMHQVVAEVYQYWSNSAQVWMYNKQKRYHYTIVFPTHVADKADRSVPEMQLYPIPAKGSVTVSLKNANNAVITLTNINGTLLREWRYSNMDYSYKQELSLAGIATGNYIMRMETAAGTVMKSFVVE